MTFLDFGHAQIMEIVMDKNNLLLYAITDTSWVAKDSTLADDVRKAIIGGATIVQYREKHLKGDELYNEAKKIQEVCKKYGVPFIVNDDVELAKKLGADGVHVGKSDMAVSKAREILGDTAIIGATAKTVEQAVEAMKQGADYLGSGAVFGTTTKADAKPMSIELLSEIVDSVNIPVVAIGGIDKTNVSKLKSIKGAKYGHTLAGVAVVSGIFAAKDIEAECRKIISGYVGTPIIHCITNIVTVNSVANVIHMSGGAPIMAHNVHEVEQVQENASALVLNLGAVDDIDAMKIAINTADNNGHPIVIDPVGCGGIQYRRQLFRELIDIATPACIRGNFSEIKALYEDGNTAKGLESNEAIDENIVKNLASTLGTIVVASGAIDIISDGKNIIKIDSGSFMQRKVTGSGCMLTAVIAVYLAYSKKASIDAVASAVKMMGDTAKIAANETMDEEKGIFTFMGKWMDNISLR